MDDALREQVRNRARLRCEYCHYQTEYAVRPFQVDNIIAEKHDGSSELHNLAWACHRCNLFKGPNIASLDPQAKELVPLFNPRTQDWSEHFRWENARLIGMTPIGRATVNVLSINDPLILATRASLIEEAVYPLL